MMRSASSGGIRHRHDLQPARLRLLRRSRPGTERDGHILDAEVAQVQRMRVALAPKPDDRDLPVLDQIHVRIAVVINAHISPFPLRAGTLANAEFPLKLGGCSFRRRGGQPFQQRLQRQRGAARAQSQRDRFHDFLNRAPQFSDIFPPFRLKTRTRLNRSPKKLRYRRAFETADSPRGRGRRVSTR